MPFHLKMGLLLVFLLACSDRKADVSNSSKPFRLLIEKASNEKQTLAGRLSAALEAYTLSIKQRDVPAQIESIRLTGMLYLRMDSTDIAMTLFRKLVNLAGSIADKESLGIAFNNIGLILSEQSVYDSAIIYYERAGKLFRSIGDSVRIVQGSINTGIAYKNIGAYEKAVSITLEATRIMETMNASAELATAYTTLGNTMKELRRPEEALAYHERAMAVRRQLHDSTGIAGSFNNIGNVYRGTKQYSLALKYYFQALELKKKLGLQRSKVTTLDNIVETYLGLEQYELAEQYEQEVLALRNEKEDRDGWMTSANRLARIYFARNETEKAKALALHISKAADAPIYLRHQLNNALLLEDIYTSTKDYPEALLYARKALSLKDSLFSSDMTAAISGMNVRFRTEEQQKKLELARKNEIIQGQQINKQKYFIILMASIILLLLIITYLLYLSNKLRKKSRERTELLMSELNHRVKNNLQVISGILNLQTLITKNSGEREIIEAGRSRVQSISIVHNLLYQKEYTGNIDMSVFISEIARNLGQTFQHTPQKSQTLLFIDNIFLKADQAIPLGLITNELLTNVYKYSRVDTGHLIVKVRMTLEKEKCKCDLCLTDNGLPWDVEAARMQKKGLGLLLVDMLVQQLKASWQSYRKDQENIHCIGFNKV